MRNIWLLLLLLVFSISLNAQKKKVNRVKAPASIYTFNSFINKGTNYLNLNKQLNLTENNFVYLNQTDLDLNNFSVAFNNIGKKPTALIYDDYKRYQDQNLLKGFLLANDPTRWCPTNFKSYCQLKQELK